MTVIITLLSIILGLAILYGGFYLARYVVEKQHRVNVLEDSYKQALDHIAALEREVTGLTHQIEHMQFEANIAEQRNNTPSGWNPRDILNSTSRQ